MVGEDRLCHVLTHAEWHHALRIGRHAPPGLAADGFLHCCTLSQLDFVLGRHFAGQRDLVVLRFDPHRAGARLEWVRSEPDQEPFPHLLGPLPVSAVLDACPVPKPPEPAP